MPEKKHKKAEVPRGEHYKVKRPKQNGYEIVLNSQDCKSLLNSQGDKVTQKGDKVTQILVRFGTLDNKKHVKDGEEQVKWLSSLATKPVVITPGQRKVVAMVDDDQLPAPANSCYYQLLCEIYSKHGKDSHIETLITDAKRLS